MSPVSERSPRGERRREGILRATLALIGERGADAVTPRAVAARAGVPLAATTYYFASKDELLEQAMLLAAREEVELMEARATELEGLDRREWAAALASFIVSGGGAERSVRVARFELALEAARRPALREPMAEWQAAYLELVEAFLRSTGSPRPAADAQVVVAALVGVDLATLGGGLDRDQLAAFVEHLLERVTAPVERAAAAPS
jgi:TetR/AcrR family transcriptional regulator, regulator of biofilm formation and stress response